MTRTELKILLLGGGIWYFGEGMFGPLLAVFTEHIGGSLLEISWAWAVYLIFYGVLSIVMGLLSDRVNKAKFMVWGYGLNAFFTFGYLIVDTPFELLFIQAALGIAAAMATPTWEALYDKYSTEEIEGLAWGISGGTASITTGIAIIIGALIVKYLSFETLFITMGIIQIIATIYQAKILRHHHHTPNLSHAVK